MPRDRITTPIKIHGGKHYLATDTVKLFPPKCKKPNAPSPRDPGYLHYVEPYYGGGSVMLAADPEGVSEVIGDINPGLMAFWTCLQSRVMFSDLQRRLEASPFSRAEFDRCLPWLDVEDITTVDLAYAFFVVARQSLSGRGTDFAAISRERTRRGMNEQASAWLSSVEGLPQVHARMIRVLIERMPAVKMIRREDGKRTLFYLDPPYLHETRITTGEYGPHEMTPQDHAELLVTLGGWKVAKALKSLPDIRIPDEWLKAKPIKGRFLLSGYRSKMYDRAAKAMGWKRHEFDLPNNAAGGKAKRRMTECVWANY